MSAFSEISVWNITFYKHDGEGQCKVDSDGNVIEYELTHGVINEVNNDFDWVENSDIKVIDKYNPDIKHRITITWGTDQDQTESYEFDTIKEQNAFLHGVEQSNGWMTYQVQQYINKKKESK